MGLGLEPDRGLKLQGKTEAESVVGWIHLLNLVGQSRTLREEQVSNGNEIRGEIINKNAVALWRVTQKVQGAAVKVEKRNLTRPGRRDWLSWLRTGKTCSHARSHSGRRAGKAPRRRSHAGSCPSWR